MLDAFIIKNHDAIVTQVRARVAVRAHPPPTEVEIQTGIPMFLDQLVEALGTARSSSIVHHDRLRESAAKHGGHLLSMGLTIGQVVHDYGDVCQVVTHMALEQKAPISGEEFSVLNLCLDDAIAGAVTEFSRQREENIAKQGTERLGVLAHELRNLINTAMLAYGTIKSGTVAAGGSTGIVLGRSLTGLRDLIDRSLADVRLDAGIDRVELIGVADFLCEIEIGAGLLAQSRGLDLAIQSVDPTVLIEGDRQILAAAISNLLQNAFKFTKKGGKVTLAAHATDGRVLFDIEDECGGLPPGAAAQLFRPFEQHSKDRSGVGLGLAICMKAARASGGDIRVRDLPGKGCIFTLDLPRKPPPPLSVIDGGKGAASVPATKARDG